MPSGGKYFIARVDGRDVETINDPLKTTFKRTSRRDIARLFSAETPVAAADLLMSAQAKSLEGVFGQSIQRTVWSPRISSEVSSYTT